MTKSYKPMLTLVSSAPTCRIHVSLQVCPSLKVLYDDFLFLNNGFRIGSLIMVLALAAYVHVHAGMSLCVLCTAVAGRTTQCTCVGRMLKAGHWLVSAQKIQDRAYRAGIDERLTKTRVAVVTSYVLYGWNLQPISRPDSSRCLVVDDAHGL